MKAIPAANVPTPVRICSQAIQVYASFFGARRPVRAVLPTHDLHVGSQIGTEAVVAAAG
jgi:hypothetical protein